jgi:hypothetical protein
MSFNHVWEKECLGSNIICPRSGGCVKLGTFRWSGKRRGKGCPVQGHIAYKTCWNTQQEGTENPTGCPLSCYDRDPEPCLHDSLPISPGTWFPWNLKQTVTFRQFTGCCPSWHWGAVMLIELGRKMETSTVMTGLALHGKRGKWVNCVKYQLSKSNKNSALRINFGSLVSI